MDHEPAPAERLTGPQLTAQLTAAGIRASAIVPDDVGLLVYLISDAAPVEDAIGQIERIPGVARVERRHNRFIVRVHPG